MRYLTVIAFILISGIIGSVSYAQHHQHAKATLPQRMILVNNPYPDQVQVTYMCVYMYKDPWKGVCEKIDTKSPGFMLRDDERLSQIQRIGLIGKSLVLPNTMSECLVHFDHSDETMKRLENSANYIAQVNYVSGSDMVCSLLKESDSSATHE